MKIIAGKYDKGMANRFTEFRKTYVAKTQLEAAPIFGIGQSRLSYIEKGVNRIPDELIKFLEKEYNMNINWLISGEKPVLKDAKEKKNTLTTTIDLNDRIDKLSQQVLILTKNLERAFGVIENQQQAILRFEKFMLSNKK